jgi:fructokinase
MNENMHIHLEENIMQRPVAVGLGEVLWDIFPNGAKFGGAPANFAYHAAALGAESHIVSAVGRDTLGEQATDFLQKRNIDTTLLAIVQNYPTGTVPITLDDAGVPSYKITQNVAWDAIPWSDDLEDLAARTDIVCFGSLGQRSLISKTTIRRFIASVPKTSLRIFDVNLRQHYYNTEILESSLLASNVLKLNEDEAPIVAELCGISVQDEVDAAVALREKFSLDIVALTLGPQGAKLVDRNKTDYCLSPQIEVVDTVGAGDAFTAALALGLYAGNPLDMINCDACWIAAGVCTHAGATPELP